MMDPTTAVRSIGQIWFDFKNLPKSLENAFAIC